MRRVQLFDDLLHQPEEVQGGFNPLLLGVRVVKQLI
jgi:hypothetical protein